MRFLGGNLISAMEPDLTAKSVLVREKNKKEYGKEERIDNCKFQRSYKCSLFPTHKINPQDNFVSEMKGRDENKSKCILSPIRLE